MFILLIISGLVVTTNVLIQSEAYLILSMFKMSLYSSYAVLGIYFILFVIACLSKNLKTIKYIHYLAYFLLIIISLNFKYIILRLDKNELVTSIILVSECLLRHIWVLLGFHSFMESMILNILSIVGSWVIYPSSFDTNIFMLQVYNYIGYSYSFVLVIITAYIILLKEKSSFYYHSVSNNEKKWLNNVFYNINNGFISIRGGDKIVYVNQFLFKNFEKYFKNNSALLFKDFDSGYRNRLNSEANLLIELKEQSNQNKTISFNTMQVRSVLQYLLVNLKSDNIDNSLINKVITNFKNEMEVEKYPDQNFLKNFARHISKLDEIYNFKLIGDALLKIELGNELSFEVHCRCIKSENNEDQLEFLFNDVTRTKLNEKQNAEFKYKTLFLSKIGHEFKNPLVCISEISNQIKDDLPEIIQQNKSNEKTFLNNLGQIKSLSEYLLILVKDLNYFSEIQMSRDTEVIKKKENLKEVVKYVNEIAQTLIKKSNKNNSIEFFTFINKDVPIKIFTDKWRLKQVLINLVSNAVKFTLYGKIVLEVSLEKREDINKNNPINNNTVINMNINSEQFIKFLVRDTGTGIKEELQKKIFTPFIKFSGNNINNEMGSGLGLNIANEIATKLGEKINLKSEYQIGSQFWFYIPLNENILCEQENENFINNSNNNCENSSKFNDNKISINNIYDDENIVHFDKNKHNSDDSVVTNEIELYPSSHQLPDGLGTNLTFEKHSVSSEIFPNNIIESFKIVDKIKINYEINKNGITKNELTLKSLNSKRNVETQSKFTIQDLMFNDVSQLRKIDTLQVYNININDNNSPRKNNENNINYSKFTKDDFINIIVVDDEVMTRQSCVNIISKISKELGLKINIIEAEDGVECIFLVYKSFTQGIKISMIFSDENMNFQNGSKSSEIIKDMLLKKNLVDIPFYLVTAYDNNVLEKYVGPSIKKILSKPLLKEIAKKLILENFKP